MNQSEDDLKRMFAAKSDNELALINREDLTDLARKCYDLEIANRPSMNKPTTSLNETSPGTQPKRQKQGLLKGCMTGIIIFIVISILAVFFSKLSAEALGGYFILALLILTIVGMWKVFVKAGRPGWAVLIPIYNIYVLLKIADDPGWWLILMLIPFVNLIVGGIVAVDLAHRFERGVVFALGMVFLPFIFIPILGFREAAKYHAAEQALAEIA
jgi:hypothetical protein